MSNGLVLAPEAVDDIRHILAWSVEYFGTAVRDGYEELIGMSIADVVNDPMRLGSRSRPELAMDFRRHRLN